MKMTSLKLSKKEAKEEFGLGQPATTKAAMENLPRYPYGTKIRLETEVLEKIGIRPSDYEVGQKLTVTCNVEVVGVTEEQRQSGERCELELQITEINIGEDKKAKKEKAEGAHLNEIAGASPKDAYDSDE